MVGDVGSLASAISDALNVPHGETSAREAIALGIATAISNYLSTVKVKGNVKMSPPQPCNAGGTHPPIQIEGELE